MLNARLSCKCGEKRRREVTETTASPKLKLIPYDITLQELEVLKQFNEHARLRFTGIVSKDQKDKYIHMTESCTQVELYLSGGEKDYSLFRGVVVHVEVKAVHDIYYLTAEAISNTVSLDVKVKSRSFQEHGMTYEDLIAQVIADNPGADFQNHVTQGGEIGGLLIQYHETDWQFLKRLASHYNTGLIPDLTSDKAKFYFGVPDREPKDLDNYHYSVYKKLNDYRNTSENYMPSIAENDFVYYVVFSHVK